MMTNKPPHFTPLICIGFAGMAGLALTAATGNVFYGAALVFSLLSIILMLFWQK